MQLKTILNRVERHSSFVYGNIRLEAGGLIVLIHARKNSRPTCSRCGCRGSTYDTASQLRRFQFVPLWGIPVWFEYSMRRVNCRKCGVKIERVPWAEGKSRSTRSFSIFLASWARRMSWKEVSSCFHVS